MSQNDYIGKTLKQWPILVDHYSISALAVIELIVEAKRLRGKTFDVWVVFEVKTEIELQNGESANNSIVLQAHELTNVVYVR